jgi:hypothetical protein
MFIGHFGVGMAAKKFAPQTSLGTLFVAASFLDLLWPLFLLMGWEEVRILPDGPPFGPLEFTSYPYSHSLLMALLWSLLAGLAYFLWKRYLAGAITVGALVVSHWFLDLFVHQPDLPLWPGSAKYGFALWNSVIGTICVEGIIFVCGVALYLAATRGQGKTGRILFWILVGVLVVLYLAATFGPPPPSVVALAWADLGSLLLVALAWFADRRRVSPAAVI